MEPKYVAKTLKGPACLYSDYIPSHPAETGSTPESYWRNVQANIVPGINTSQQGIIKASWLPISDDKPLMPTYNFTVYIGHLVTT